MPMPPSGSVSPPHACAPCAPTAKPRAHLPRSRHRDARVSHAARTSRAPRGTPHHELASSGKRSRVLRPKPKASKYAPATISKRAPGTPPASAIFLPVASCAAHATANSAYAITPQMPSHSGTS
eukprot:IDg18851t1